MELAPPTNGTPFSEHLLGKMTRTRLAVDSVGPTLAVKDQMLFAKGASPVSFPPQVGPHGAALGVKKYLDNLGITYRKATTVFHGLPNPGGYDDVDIVEVGNLAPSGATVFSITDDLRAPAKGSKPAGALAASPNSVSPNHVLIPAPNEFWCPYGPPSPLPEVPILYPGGLEGVGITVIDNGYMWNPAWGDNPLDHLASSVSHHNAEWLGLNYPNALRGPGWAPGKDNVIDANADKKLDALVGHANFVAGVIAQHCELPNIHIWSHSSAFLYDRDFDNFSTEAAICRSLVMSQQDTATPVIHIGHASAFKGNIASVVWGLAFARIGPGLDPARNLADEVVITCPAGNQGLLPPPQGTIPRFPATLNSAYPFVKGVASVDDSGVRSPWSNHGPWVACSAIGKEVASTFLYVDAHVEDGNTKSNGVPAEPPRNFKNNSWATWNGTSFASPKIAGLIAARLGPHSNPSQAWTTLVQTHGTVQNSDVGFIFTI
jgi:hypothetical protein